MRSAIFLYPFQAGDTALEVMEGFREAGIDVHCVHPDTDADALAGLEADALVLDASACPAGDGGALGAFEGFDGFTDQYEATALCPLRMLASCLPLLLGSQEKRVCVIGSSPAGYQDDMRLSALYMGLKLLFNALRPKGYTFRLLREEPSGAGFAVGYFLKPRAGGEEDRLVLRGATGREIPW